MTTCTDTILDAYLECALWCSNDDDGDPLDDHYGPEDLTPDARERAAEDVMNFLASARAEDLELCTAGMIGHDLWLTRNGHGAGFWDRGLGDAGDRLTAEADAMGTCDIYVDIDGELWLS